MIKVYRDYLVAILVASLIGATAVIFGPSWPRDLPIVVDLLLGTILYAIMSSALGVVILAVSWLFTRVFTFQRFIKITTGVSIIWALVALVDVLLDRIR